MPDDDENEEEKENEEQKSEKNVISSVGDEETKETQLDTTSKGHKPTDCRFFLKKSNLIKSIQIKEELSEVHIGGNNERMTID